MASTADGHSQYNGHEHLSLNSMQQKELRNRAAGVIERAYLSYRDKQMFTLLKHAVRAAEQSWTHEILRKISPREAELVNDPSVNAKVRFRFGGSEFPPIILFKIYLVSNGTKYISGKKQIRAASNAAADSCRLMGNRKFYDQMIIDACQYEKDKVTDEVDVTTLKDYMQYISNMDETPCYLGGKENYWRQLTLQDLPRNSIIFDIVEYLQTKTPTERLRDEIPTLMSRPITQDVQLQHIRAITRMHSPTQTLPLPRTATTQRSPMRSQRRSLQSRKRAAKMKKMYVVADDQDTTTQLDLIVRATSTSPTRPTTTPDPEVASDITKVDGATLHPSGMTTLNPSGMTTYRTQGTQDEPGDAEAHDLYEWTKELNIDDINNIGGRYSTLLYSRQSTTSRSVSYSSPNKSPIKRNKGIT